MNKNKIKEGLLGGEEKTTVNVKKDDLGDTKVTTNLQKLGKNVSVNVVDEEASSSNKTITDKQLSKLAQQAGNFGVDVKDALFDLMMVGDVIPLDMVVKVLSNYDLRLKDLKGQDATFKPSAEFAHLFNSSLKEDDAEIEPQDNATIKYLSNIKDEKTGEISKPFTIGDKKYQMVRGIHPSGEHGLAVFCHDDMDNNGENLIHSMEYFEENIAKPMKEEMGMVGQDIQVVDEDTYEGFKHYLVNKQTNEVRKFKTIEEILSCNKLSEEEYMGVSGFKKYMNERLFGARKRKEETLTEIAPTGEENDEEMNVKAKKLMELISKRIPQNIVKTIKTPVAKREVIAAFAELIGVPRNGLTSLVSSLKDLSKLPTGQPAQEPITEKKVITKKALEDSLTTKKIIKLKDLR